MTQPTARPEARPDTSRVVFENINDTDDPNPPARLARLHGFILGRGLGACVGNLLLALLCLGLIVAEVWGAWIICDLMSHAAVHQWQEWHHG